MAIYRLENIMRDVRIALDENMSSEKLTLLGDVDTLSLNDIIKSKVEEGVKRVHSSAPSYLLDCGHNFGEELYWGEMCSGWVLLPEDFMRLVVFQMDDWSRAVYHAISEDDPLYILQSSRYKGLRGVPQRPVCAIAIRPEGRVLEFYSCKSEEAKVSRGVYLPYPCIDRDGGIEICMKCYTAVVYTIASLASVTLGESEKSNVFNELAKSALI